MDDIISPDTPLFQPSPNLKAGCNAVILSDSEESTSVSTLTQPQGRVQHHPQTKHTTPERFQPSPNLKG